MGATCSGISASVSADAVPECAVGCWCGTAWGLLAYYTRHCAELCCPGVSCNGNSTSPGLRSAEGARSAMAVAAAAFAALPVCWFHPAAPVSLTEGVRRIVCNLEALLAACTTQYSGQDGIHCLWRRWRSRACYWGKGRRRLWLRSLTCATAPTTCFAKNTIGLCTATTCPYTSLEAPFRHLARCRLTGLDQRRC